MLEFIALAQQCAPTVEPQTMAAVAQVESSFNPYAIGVVGGRLQRQPRSLEEAVATASALEAEGWNFSVGLAQVNRHNLPKYKLNYEQAFDPCANLRAGSQILEDCYVRARRRMPDQDEQAALQAAFSCYYSGNFTRGFRPDRAGEPSYVQKVYAAASVQAPAIPVVPAVAGAKPPSRDRAAGPASPVVVQPGAASPPAAPLPPSDHSSVMIDLHGQPEPAGEAAAVVESPEERASSEEPQAAQAAATSAPVRLRPARPAAETAPAQSAGVVVF